MGIEGILVSEMSDRERQTPYSLTYAWKLKQTNHQKQNKKQSGGEKKSTTHVERDQICGSRGGVGEWGMGGRAQTSRCNILDA